MYRYLLFFYYDYYPSGGMNDCVLKTNNYDDMERVIKEEFQDELTFGNIAYYDTVEDKYFIASTTWDQDRDKLQVDGWEEK